MQDIIQILPDSVANQIAAGEVIQRPASAIKELMENAVDARATVIKVIVKEAGKTFIQVSDNGAGMSPSDARLSFARHATSKIKTSDDLFALHTKGFRGEALASIAAVAKVNVKTKRAEDDTGTQLDVEDSRVILQEPCAGADGTTFSIKSLFYNVPARRKFLKSDAVELKHIIEEFQRVALAHPELSFHLYNGNTPIYQLEPGTFRQRIVGILGNAYNERLVPVEEQTDIVKISGFILKPDFAKKTRGEQFFFVNNRFIKNPYLHHGVSGAFEELIARDAYPGYFIRLEVDPEKIDINIHPTKTEVKFEDERLIYAMLKSAVRQALGKYNITASLDFDQEGAFQFEFEKDIAKVPPPQINFNPDYNPFSKETASTGRQSAAGPNRHPEQKSVRNTGQWKQFYEISREALADENKEPKYDAEELPEAQKEQRLFSGVDQEVENIPFFQWMQRYIVAALPNGIKVIDQHRAHERVIYERLCLSMERNGGYSQMELFPETIALNPADYALITEMMPDLKLMGLELEPFGGNAVVVRGIPTDAVDLNIRTIIEGLLEQFKNSNRPLKSERTEMVAKILASKMAIRSGVLLNKLEVFNLIQELFACKMPYVSPNGKPVMFSWEIEEIEQQFLKR